MKKIGIITLTRQDSLACSSLKKIVSKLGFQAICGEAIGAESIYMSLEDLTVRGYDFLSSFFMKAGFSESDVILISAPYSANLFVLPKVIGCLKNICPAPIILGGNEASNNYKNILQHRYCAFANQVLDVAPDFIVRGAAENVLFALLPLLDKTVMKRIWDRPFVEKLLAIPNLAFWIPDRQALISTPFSSKPLKEDDIFSHVRLGDKTIAITLQRACVWAKKSKGGCLFCAIASQFGKDFHCAVQTDSFIHELGQLLKNNSGIEFVDVWDDTFNINEAWALKICGFFKKLTEDVGRQITYSCFLRPKGLTEKLARKMGETSIKVAFLGADALTEELSKRMRRGCTVSEMNRTLQVLKKGRILPRLSVQLFSPESTLDDAGITAALALSCIHNNESTSHVHLYTFPLFGSDIYALLNVRGNLKKIPTPLLKPNSAKGFIPYQMAYDYALYDPDLEHIKQKMFRLLNITTSFFVRTYPGDDVDANKLKEILSQVRNWCSKTKQTHPIQIFMGLCSCCTWRKRGKGLSKQEILQALARNDTLHQIPEHLKRSHGNFGYAFTLARTFDEVAQILVSNRWATKDSGKKYHLTREGLARLHTVIAETKESRIKVAAYPILDRSTILASLKKSLFPEPESR
jgi:radical SAM superfamily enzyme YgiQ (UPF0313 family)